MIQKAIDHPFRPPKSPSSIVVHKTIGQNATPKSPPRKKKTRRILNDTPKRSNRSEDVSDALSPTSVVDPRGLFRDRTRPDASRNRPEPANTKPASTESDRSLVEAGNQCLKVRKRKNHASIGSFLSLQVHSHIFKNIGAPLGV